MLPEFELLMPGNLEEALQILKDAEQKILPIAGGTNMIIDMREGRRSAARLINVAGLEGMKRIDFDNESFCVGGGVTISELRKNPLIAKYATCLSEAAKLFANPLICNRATVGGNLVDASPAADMAPPLLVLDAEVELVSLRGKRLLPLDQFFIHVRKTAIEHDELLVSVRWQLPSENSRSGFEKIGLRKADAISVVSAAVLVEKKPDGKVTNARIALGSVAPTPIRATAAEEMLIGEYLAEAVIEDARRLAAEATKPISDIRGSSEYRRKVAGVIVSRLLKRVNEESRKRV